MSPQAKAKDAFENVLGSSSQDQTYKFVLTEMGQQLLQKSRSVLFMICRPVPDAVLVMLTSRFDQNFPALLKKQQGMIEEKEHDQFAVSSCIKLTTGKTNYAKCRRYGWLTAIAPL
jgi:hypothetical protein